MKMMKMKMKMKMKMQIFLMMMMMMMMTTTRTTKEEDNNKKLLVKNHNQKQGPGTLPEDAKPVYFCAHFFFKTFFVVPGQRVCQSDTSRPELDNSIISSIQNFFLEAWTFINLVRLNMLNYCSNSCEDLKSKSCENLCISGNKHVVLVYYFLWHGCA